MNSRESLVGPLTYALPPGRPVSAGLACLNLARLKQAHLNLLRPVSTTCSQWRGAPSSVAGVMKEGAMK